MRPPLHDKSQDPGLDYRCLSLQQRCSWPKKYQIRLTPDRPIASNVNATAFLLQVPSRIIESSGIPCSNPSPAQVVIVSAAISPLLPFIRTYASPRQVNLFEIVPLP
jgi:hypothetical protein